MAALKGTWGEEDEERPSFWKNWEREEREMVGTEKTVTLKEGGGKKEGGVPPEKRRIFCKAYRKGGGPDDEEKREIKRLMECPRKKALPQSKRGSSQKKGGNAKQKKEAYIRREVRKRLQCWGGQIGSRDAKRKKKTKHGI